MANKSPINLSSNWILTHGNSLYNCSTTEFHNTPINNNGSTTAGPSSSGTTATTTTTTKQQQVSSDNESKSLDSLISLDRAIALKQPLLFETENDFVPSKIISNNSNNNNNNPTTTNTNSNNNAITKSAKYCDFFIKCDKECKIHEIRLVCDCEKIEIFTGEMEEYYRLCYGKSLLDDDRMTTDDEQTKAYIFNITMAFNVVNCIRIKFIQPQVIWIYSLNTIISNLIKPPSSMYKSMNNKIDFENVDAYLANCNLSEKAKNFHDFMKASTGGNSQFNNLESAKAFFLQATLAGRGLNLNPSIQQYQQHPPFSFPGQHHSIPSQSQQQQQQQQQHYQKHYQPYQTVQQPPNKKENHNKLEDNESVIMVELKSYFDKRLMEIERNLSERIDEKLYEFEQRQIERFDKISSLINNIKCNAMKGSSPEQTIEEKLKE